MKFTTHPLEASSTRVAKIEFFPEAEAHGVDVDAAAVGPFRIRWEAFKADVMIRETVYARVSPFHRKRFGDNPTPIVEIRDGVPAEGTRRILDFVNTAIGIGVEVKKEIDAGRRAQREAAAALPVVEPEPVPVSLHERVFSTHRDAQQEVVMHTPVGHVMRGLSGIAAQHDEAFFILPRNNDGSEMTFRIRGRFIGDLDIKVRRATINEEEVTFTTSGAGGRKILEEGLRTEIDAGAHLFEQFFDQGDLGRALNDVNARPDIDPFSVIERTGHLRRQHMAPYTLEMGDISVTGVGMGYSLDVKFRGLPFAQIGMKQYADTAKSKLSIISPEMTPDVNWLIDRDVATQIEMLWRCGCAGLDPENFPALDANFDALRA